MTNYPEHEKLKAVQEKSQIIGEFISEFLPSKEIILCTYADNDIDLIQVHYDTHELLSMFFGIDLEKLEEEKQQMLDSIREEQ